MKLAVILVALLTVVNVGAALVNLSIVAKADVAGMSGRELQRDRAFRTAVENIVSDCSAQVERGEDRYSITCP